jgi:hypothetical protein
VSGGVSAHELTRTLVADVDEIADADDERAERRHLDEPREIAHDYTVSWPQMSHQRPSSTGGAPQDIQSAGGCHFR